MPSIPELARNLGCLSDPAMRRGVLAEVLRDAATDPAEVAARLAEVVSCAPFDPSCRLTLLALAEILADPEALPEPRREEIYVAASHLGAVEVCRLFHDAPPSREAPPYRPPPLSRPKTRDTLTLGERRALARRPDRKVFERLVLDPEPLVVRELLGNPKVTEADVLRIATRRPVRPEVLAEVARSRRWMARYTVRLALVRNPYSPTGLAVRLVGLLMAQDLDDVAADGSLHPQVRQAAASALKQRHGRPDPQGGECT